MCNDLLIFAPSILMKLAQVSLEVRITNSSGRNEPNVFQRFEPSWPVSIHVLALKGVFFEVMFVGITIPITKYNFNELGFLQVLQCSNTQRFICELCHSVLVISPFGFIKIHMFAVRVPILFGNKS